MNHIGIKLAIGALGPLPFISRTKTRRKRKREEIYEGSIVLKYIKVKRSKLNTTEIYII